MRLVGFIVRIYQDARSHGCQIRKFLFMTVDIAQQTVTSPYYQIVLWHYIL